MGTLHLLGKLKDKDIKPSRSLPANFGTDVPRLYDILHVDSVGYRVILVDRVLRNNVEGQLVQYERYVWAREMGSTTPP